MLNLLLNENLKIYSRPRTWTLALVLLVGILLMAILAKTHSSHAFTAWSFVNATLNVSVILIAFIAAVVGDIMAGEFSSGTIKMLLTQTSTRSRIFASKYLASLLYALLFALYMFVISYVIGGLFFGFGGAGTAYHYVNASHQTTAMALSSYVLMQYGFLFVQIIIMMTIAFMISAIFRSSALAITISILAFVIGSVLVQELARYYSWVKYILFANTDLSQYFVGGPVIHGSTLGFSITMLALYFIVMMVLSWILFAKRDVAYT